MQYRVPTWLADVLKDAPRGFQAAIARHAKMAPDRLSKVLSGTRSLKHDEAEALQQAIETLQTDAPKADRSGPEPLSEMPEGEAIVRKVVAKTHGKGRPAELVFLLERGGWFACQLPARLVQELRDALSDS